MRKLMYLVFLGFICSTMFATNVTNGNPGTGSEPIGFPVYCDGEYAGTATSIEEALKKCGL